MTEQILEILHKLGVEKYLIDETESESLECFFIRRKLDLKRRKKVTQYEVTVFAEFEKDGQRMLGSGMVRLHPGMSEKELCESLTAASRRALLVENPYYELAEGKKEDFVPQEGSLVGKPMEEIMKATADAIFAADVHTEVFLNSTEVFVRRSVKHIVNSEGVDVSFEAMDVWGEYVVQCTEPQNVEIYRQFGFKEMDTEALRREVEEAIDTTRSRARAKQAPKAGEYRVILSGPQMYDFIQYYLTRANASMVYRKYSNFEAGASVQGEQENRSKGMR